MKMKLKVMFKKGPPLLGLAPLLVSVVGCGGDPGGAAPIPPDPMLVADEARLTYANIVLANYQDTLDSATVLDGDLTALVAEPSSPSLEAARDDWRNAREPYLQTEVYRFYGGPIDDPDTGCEGMLNAWPLDENYIDYVVEDDSAGIINNLQQVISEDTLSDLNEGGGEKNISTGYHAIEFLLWGQDRSADGPGDRPYTDYVTGASGTAANQDRRAEYLLTVSGILREDLQGLVDAWSEGDASNYRTEFVRDIEPKEALRRMLTGMILLTGNETGGERLQAALATHEQEDEHSCFSDNTHRDMIQDVQGVINVWHGVYVRPDGSTVEGTGVGEVVHAKNGALAEQISDKLDECLELANAIHPPFDQEIAAGNDAGNDRVRALVTALQDASSLFEQAFMKFGLEVPQRP
jgi:putative iron-regulated protein